jgi:hypothetical protein
MYESDSACDLPRRPTRRPNSSRRPYVHNLKLKAPIGEHRREKRSSFQTSIPIAGVTTRQRDIDKVAYWNRGAITVKTCEGLRWGPHWGPHDTEPHLFRLSGEEPVYAVC